MTRRPPASLALLLAMVGMALAACAAKNVPTGLIPTPPRAAPEPTTSIAPNLAATVLAPVPGHATTTEAITGGAATVSGTVDGPSGPVGGADVHIERVTDVGVAGADTISNPDGTWSMPGLRGGRFRVRAWRAPDLDLTTPEIFFLAANESHVVALHLAPFTGAMVSSAVNPAAPVAEQPFDIAVVVATGAVDVTGVARANPVPFAKVQLTTTGDLEIDSVNPDFTDATGRVEWQVVCHTVGPQTVNVVIQDTDTVAINVPACGSPTTTTTPGASTTAPANTTTTSKH